MAPIKTILITGAATRLGREMALHLAERGWNVAVHYRASAEAAMRTVKEIQAIGRQSVAIKGDLCEEGVPARIIQAATDALGTITALVNNAAIFERDNLTNFDSGLFHAHMNLNLLVPLLLSQAFAAKLGNQKGTVVNIVDGCEGLSLSPNFLSYALSKYALREATFLLAKGLAPNIRVNGICPGLTLPKPGEEEIFDRLLANVPTQKATEPADIAATIAYVLETPSLNGQVLSLNGGLKATH